MFVDRETELGLLEKRFERNKAEFIVLYGRRRIGKTTLLLELLRRHNGIYLLARETSKIENLRRFSHKFADYFDDDLVRKNPLHDWDSFFEYLTQKIQNRQIVVLDEFPYLVKSDSSLPSVLQEYWDQKLSSTRIFFVICGSSISMMEKLLGYKNPLYGRRTAQLRLESMDFGSAKAFLPSYSIEDFVRAYGIVGGTPTYLLEFNDKISLKENITNYFKRTSFLYQDAFFVLREELDEPRTYFAIMESVARGKTTLGAIMNATGLARAVVGKYLSVLIDLGLIRREVSITASWKSRKGRYYLNDPYFLFWFRFVHPNIDLIETDQGELLVTQVLEDFNQYLGKVFEDIAIQLLLKLNKAKILPFRFYKIGRWWYKDQEIDIVALNEHEKIALFLEVKWSDLDATVAKEILTKLEDKSQFVGLDDWRKYYGIIAKKIDKVEKLNEEKWIVFALKDFETYLDSVLSESE
ncbi:MAG: ATP-binding protein [Candidatus Thorarchaeota archaeon]